MLVLSWVGSYIKFVYRAKGSRSSNFGLITSGSADLRKGNSVKKRLSDGTLKERTAKVSKQFKLSFDSEAEKLSFLLNDMNGDVYRSDSEQHKHLLSKVHMRKQ